MIRIQKDRHSKFLADALHQGGRLPATLADAWKNLLADLEARKLSDSTIRKYKLLERHMEVAPYLFKEHREGKKGEKILVLVHFSWSRLEDRNHGW